MSSFSQKLAIFTGIVAFAAAGTVAHAAQLSSPEASVASQASSKMKLRFDFSGYGENCVGKFSARFSDSTIAGVESGTCSNLDGGANLGAYDFELKTASSEWRTQAKTVDVVINEQQLSVSFRDSAEKVVASVVGDYKGSGSGSATFQLKN